MCSFASNAIGSHAAPLRATLLHFFSKNIFRTLFFRTRSQKGTFKAFPTKWYTLSLFQSNIYASRLSRVCRVCGGAAPAHARRRDMTARGFTTFTQIPRTAFRAWKVISSEIAETQQNIRKGYRGRQRADHRAQIVHLDRTPGFRFHGLAST